MISGGIKKLSNSRQSTQATCKAEVAGVTDLVGWCGNSHARALTPCAQEDTNRQETVKKTLENPLVTRDLQNFSVCQMGFKS